MTTVATLAASLQAIFTVTAVLVGRLSGFIIRVRQLTADAFAQTLVFGWIDQPTATLESFAPSLGLSAQALHQRLTQAARQFFLDLLAKALLQVQAAHPTRLRLFQRFAAVIVEDTTFIPLPADLASDYRGSGGRALLKVLLRWDLVTGRLLALETAPGVTHDTTLVATAAELPVRALHLADQGFFDTQRWAQLRPGQYWISRVPSYVSVAAPDGVWQGLADFLADLAGDTFDGWVQLVASQGLRCRLVARRCPAEVTARRRQKLREYTRSKKGREPSARQLELCGWLVLATNVPANRLRAPEVWSVYRSRWQVELLIKRGKQQLRWTFSHGHKGERVLVEVLAKLLGCVVVHWATLLRGGPLGGVSPVSLFAIVRRHALTLQRCLRQQRGLRDALAELLEELGGVRRQPKRHTKPSTRQILDTKQLVF